MIVQERNEHASVNRPHGRNIPAFRFVAVELLIGITYVFRRKFYRLYWSCFLKYYLHILF